MSKKQCVDKHFAVRCVQRLGYIPDIKKLVSKIQNGELEFYCRESNRVTQWKWKDSIKGINCILPYDNHRKQIITVLFEDINTYLKNGRVLNEG